MLPDFLAIADKATFLQLLFLAIVVGMAVKHLACQESLIYGGIAGGILLVTYFLHRFTFEAEIDVLVEALFRSLCVAHIGLCSTSVVATLCMLISMKSREIRHAAYRRRLAEEARREQVRKAIQELTPKPAPPPPPPFSERIRSLARQAREEYDAEVQALNSLPLDEDEREILIMRAKRSLLRKLQGDK